MIVSINQPAYLPWRPYFDRIAMSDLHIVLDHVPFSKGSFVNRTRIQLPDGRLTWLTVPVEKGKSICETIVSSDVWKRKHWKTLCQSYPEIIDTWYKNVFNREYEFLSEVCRESVFWFEEDLGIETEFLYSSQLPSPGHKTGLILNLCREVEADVYLSGPLGRNYLDLPAFVRAGIEVRFHDYTPPDPPVSVLHELFPRVSGTSPLR